MFDNVHYRIMEFAEELNNQIMDNESKDEYRFNTKTIELMEMIMKDAVILGKVMHEVDKLYSGDSDEQDFIMTINALVFGNTGEGK